MGAFGGAKAQNFLKVLAPVGARKEAFTDGGRAKKSDIFSRLLALVGAAAGEKKNPDAQKSTSVSYPLPANRPGLRSLSAQIAGLGLRLRWRCV